MNGVYRALFSPNRVCDTRLEIVYLGPQRDENIDVLSLEVVTRMTRDHGVNVLQQGNGLAGLVVPVLACDDVMEGGHCRQDGIEPERGDVLRHEG